MPHPPHALRVLHLSDRLILHDLSATLQPPDLINRNALIAAANHAQTVHNATPTLLDLPTPPSNIKHSYCTIPFDTNKQPFLSRTPEEVGIPHNPPVEVALGVLGILNVPAGRFCVMVESVKEGGRLPKGKVYVVSKVRCVALGASEKNGELLQGIVKLLESGSVYFMVEEDLTKGKEGFWWTWKMAEKLGDASSWGLKCVYGFVGSRQMRCVGGEFWMTLVSRRSRRRAGTRYITRGVDGRGDVANFVETEQVVWSGDGEGVGFIVIRGSVPVFWRQNNGIARPVPELDGGLKQSRMAFGRHFNELGGYGGVCAVSLVDKGGSEGVLAGAFERFMELEKPNGVNLVAFDFHKWCAGKEYERGLGRLMGILQDDIKAYGVGEGQNGVFRVNCVDCLDRTNVVQSMIARVALGMQLEKVLGVGSGAREGGRLYTESEDGYKHIWGDNADAVSKQYSGTGALKTDFTRTGKRSTTGVIGDGVKSVMRMYYKNFVDEGRQEIIDVICGNAVFRQPRMGEGESGKQGGLWYSFESYRVNAGGDKQGVVVELYDEMMYVITMDGIAVEYPRNALVSWSKEDEGKSSDRKTGAGKLRLWYHPTDEFPGTTSPLDLQFKSGPTARENFVRAVLSWAKSETMTVLQKQEDVRVRVLGALNAGEHRMIDWGLDNHGEDRNEVVALILPEANAGSRAFGLAAVPMDVDNSGFELVSARSVSDRGPAIAILVSKRTAKTVMNVREAISGRAAAFFASGAVGVSLEVCGTSLGFVSAKLNGPMDIFHTISSLKLGRSNFDVTNQFHHFVMAGNLGDVQWHRDGTPQKGQEGRKWVELRDGSACYSLSGGMSVMRNSFPSMRYDDKLNSESVWNVQRTADRLGMPMTYMTLSEGIINGRAGPSLPRQVSQSTIVLSDLRGEEIKMPPGLDQNAALNSQLALYCEYAAVDVTMSKPTARASASPAWSDVLLMPVMPLDRDEVLNSFIIGQVVVPNALGDDAIAGHFVIPIKCAQDGGDDFEVPCRLAGMTMGRLLGKIRVESGDAGSLAEELKQLGVSGSPRSTRSKSGITPSFSSRYELPPSAKSTIGDLGISGMSGKQSEGMSARGSGKPSMDELNVRLDAVRRKGSKQIKSVVSKLSGYLNQQSGNGGGAGSMSRTGSASGGGGGSMSRTGSGSGGVGLRKLRGDYSHGTGVDWENDGEFKETIEEDGEIEGDGFGGFQGAGARNVFGNESATSRSRGGLEANRWIHLTEEGRPVDVGEVRRTKPVNVGALRPGGEVRRPPSGASGARPRHVMDDGEDLLLSGLKEEKRHDGVDDLLLNGLKDERNGGGGSNLLLNGLKEEKKKNDSAEDDDWGDFESAGWR